MYYDIKQNCRLCTLDSIPDKHFIACIRLSTKEAKQQLDEGLSQIVQVYSELPYTRAEFYEGLLYGSIYMPQLLNNGEVRLIFKLEKDRLYFLSTSPLMEDILASAIRIRRQNITDPGTAFYYFLEQLLDDDLEKINAIQDNLSQLESKIFQEPEGDYGKKLTDFRRKTLQLSHYYMQLSALATMLSENTYGYFSSKQLDLFRALANRIMLLKNEADQLWDHTLQVREVYQERLSVRQNEIMKFFTMVTTLFFPLSLVTGWYGMNFEHMPEIKWEFGYHVLIAISLVVELLLCLWFKKKKFW